MNQELTDVQAGFRKDRGTRDQTANISQIIKRAREGTSLVVQWLRDCTPNAEGPGSITGQGTRSHMPQQRSSAAK